MCKVHPPGEARARPRRSPVALTSPQHDDESVTIVTHDLRLRPGASHGWEPRSDEVCLVSPTLSATLQSVLLRWPGEHRIDAHRPIAEIQLRFTGTGRPVGLAVPVIAGGFSDELDRLRHGRLNLRRVLPGRRLAAYTGTETIPPADRPMTWLVAVEPLHARLSQVAELISLPGRSLPARPLQTGEAVATTGVRARLIELHSDHSSDTPDPAGIVS